ncbi:MAG: PQQ-dependent catabolism-associated CXXCW motif protein [SAR324 cluster bacterium]|nr:PQQ-dependent catabolism-associated CXXCW motif protein [SAR324 cluster bacterium]
MILAVLLAMVHAQATDLSDNNWEIENFTFEGYRIAHYRRPTPESVEGGTTVNTQQLQRLIAAERPLLVDVLPLLYRHGRFIVEKPHEAIPGSYWLPNVGYGELLPEWERYLMDFLRDATRLDKDTPMVFYCTPDCWMS